MSKNKNVFMYGITGVFSIIILFLGITGIGFVPVASYGYIDTLLVPVTIGSMIGMFRQNSYKPAIILGATWFLILIVQGSYYCMATTISSTILISIIVAYLYKKLREKNKHSTANAFLAMFLAVTIRSIIVILSGYYDLYQYIFFTFIPELLFSLVMLGLILDKLRAMQLLNGFDIPRNPFTHFNILDILINKVNDILNTNITRCKEPNPERGDN